MFLLQVQQFPVEVDFLGISFLDTKKKHGRTTQYRTLNNWEHKTRNLKSKWEQKTTIEKRLKEDNLFWKWNGAVTSMLSSVLWLLCGPQNPSLSFVPHFRFA